MDNSSINSNVHVSTEEHEADAHRYNVSPSSPALRSSSDTNRTNRITIYNSGDGEALVGESLNDSSDDNEREENSAVESERSLSEGENGHASPQHQQQQQRQEESTHQSNSIPEHDRSQGSDETIDSHTGNQPHIDANSYSYRNTTPDNNSTIYNNIQIILASIWQLFRLLISLLHHSISHPIPSKQLHMISITLLFVHRIVEVIIAYLPHVWYMVFTLFGHDRLPPKLQNLTNLSDLAGAIATNTTAHSNMTDIELLKYILETIIGDAFPDSEGQQHLHQYRGQASTLTTMNYNNTNLLVHFKKPILSIIIPTTILSIFLFLTTTVFLVVHMCFQAFMCISSRMSSSSRQRRGAGREGAEGDNNNENFAAGVGMYSSPFVLWGIISILILETVLPWICLSFGVYLSFSVGGLTWSFFVMFMYFASAGLRYLRNRIYAGFYQDGVLHHGNHS